MEPKQKMVMIVAGILVLGLLVFGVINIVAHRGKLHIAVLVTPSDSSLTIDGRPAKPGKVWLTKTTHTFKATRQYFDPVSRTLNLANIDSTTPIYVNPLPNSPEAQKYLSEHPEEQTQREAAGAAQATSTQNQLNKDSLVGKLPFFAPGDEFTVDYDTTTDANGNSKVTIFVIADSDTAKQHALDWIRRQGSDPANLTIVYQTSDTPPDPSIGH